MNRVSFHGPSGAYVTTITAPYDVFPGERACPSGDDVATLAVSLRGLLLGYGEVVISYTEDEYGHRYFPGGIVVPFKDVNDLIVSMVRVMLVPADADDAFSSSDMNEIVDAVVRYGKENEFWV